MDDQNINFPCTNKCLVFASCTILCMKYIDYVQETYRSKKYGCFKIIPDPPQQIQELAEILNRVEGDKYVFNYYPYKDLVIISLKSSPKLCSIIHSIRKLDTLKYNERFPEDFR